MRVRDKKSRAVPNDTRTGYPEASLSSQRDKRREYIWVRRFVFACDWGGGEGDESAHTLRSGESLLGIGAVAKMLLPSV